MIKRLRKIKFRASGHAVVRSVSISAVAIALAVYAIVLHSASVVVLGAVILLVAAGAILQVGAAVRELHDEKEQTRRSAERAEHHYFKVLRRIVSAVEAREPYTRGRSKRIGFLARRIGEEMHLDRDTCRLLDLAGQVHDIGLLAVPEYILNKPSRLGHDEFRAVKKHADVAFRILEPLNFLSSVLPAIRYHHERMNGTGYPYGMSADAIPQTACIMAVADAYDAMTHDRPHRAALPPIEAINELRRCSPEGYDALCVKALGEVMHMRHLQAANDLSDSDEEASREVSVKGHSEPPGAGVPAGSASELAEAS